MDVKHCSGCRNNFYNGNNPHGIKECWSLKDAELVPRIAVGLWEDPPYLNKQVVQVPKCWHGEGNNRIVYIDPSDVGPDGFWR